MAQYTGIVTITIDGVKYSSMSGAKLEMGGFKRKSIIANGRVKGFSKTGVESRVTFTMPHGRGDDATIFDDMEDVTLLFECDSDQIYKINGAFSEEPGTLNEEEGKLDLKFAGPKAQLQK
jgi:hypothetical protein